MTTEPRDTLAVESIIARHIVARAVWVSPPLIALFALTRGWSGGWSATLGVVVVIANFLLAGSILSISARISLAAYHAAALLGFFLRLGLLILTILLIARFVPIDRLAFGVSTVASYLVLLSWEAVAVSKGRERDLDWTS